jgi:aminoglycoside phosphotransferase (APT) family kinase protein
LHPKRIIFIMSEIDLFVARLAQYLTEQNGVPTTIHNPKPLSGGASRDTWLFTATTPEKSEQLVIRRDLPTQMFEQALTRAQEYHLMDTAYRHGIKVAQMRYLCTDNSVLGSPFFIMAYVAGISIGTKVIHTPELAHARSLLPEQLAQQLALIHTMPYHTLDFLPRTPLDKTPAQDVIVGMYGVLDALKVNNPTWEWTLRWAQNHLPAQERTTFIHGDYRIGNLLVDEHGLSAVIDWEFGHIGDPNEEFGYICMRDWRFGNGHLHFAGLSERERFLRAYEQASGISLNRRSVDWWEILGNIRWGIICMSQANRHLSGEESSVELVSLGRRSAEMQLEALRLIEAYGEI